MYICVCEYSYVCICIYVCVFVYMCVFLYVCICVFVYVYICRYICVYVYVYMCVIVCMYLCIYVCVFLYVCIYVYVYILIYTCVHSILALGCVLSSAEQRNVQKNFNVPPSSGLSHRPHGLKKPVEARSGTVDHNLIQTNLSCLYWPSQEKQTNLNSKSKRFGLGNGADIDNPEVDQKRNHPRKLSRSNHDVPPSEDGMGSKEKEASRRVLGRFSKQRPHGGVSFSSRHVETPSQGSFHRCSSSPSLDSSTDPSSPGPTLLSEHLVENRPSSPTFLRSSGIDSSNKHLQDHLKTSKLVENCPSSPIFLRSSGVDSSNKHLQDHLKTPKLVENHPSSPTFLRSSGIDSSNKHLQDHLKTSKLVENRPSSPTFLRSSGVDSSNKHLQDHLKTSKLVENHPSSPTFLRSSGVDSSNKHLQDHLKTSKLVENRPSSPTFLRSSGVDSSNKHLQDHLKTSKLGENRPSSPTLQDILRSSDLGNSIQRVQEHLKTSNLVENHPSSSRFQSILKSSDIDSSTQHLQDHLKTSDLVDNGPSSSSFQAILSSLDVDSSIQHLQEHIKTSKLVENRPSSPALQDILRSSDLSNSVQHLQEHLKTSDLVENCCASSRFQSSDVDSSTQHLQEHVKTSKLVDNCPSSPTLQDILRSSDFSNSIQRLQGHLKTSDLVENHPSSSPKFQADLRSSDLSSSTQSLRDSLGTSDLVENCSSSPTFHDILKSSDPEGSIQHLQNEAEMGALGSFPSEPKYSSLPRPSWVSPPGSASAPLSIMERLTAEQKWDSSFGRDFGDGEPLRRPSIMETLEHSWPTVNIRSNVSPTSALFPSKDTSFSYLFRSHWGGQWNLDPEEPSSGTSHNVGQQDIPLINRGWPKTDSHQTRYGLEEPPGASHNIDLSQQNLPLNSGWLKTDSHQKRCGLEDPSSEVSRHVDVGQQDLHLANHDWPKTDSHQKRCGLEGASSGPSHPVGLGQQDLPLINRAWLKTDSHQMRYGLEDPSSGVSHNVDVGQQDLLFGLLSTSNTDREGHLTVQSSGAPSGQDSNLCEPGESIGTLFSANFVDDQSLFLPHWKLRAFEGAKKGEGSPASKVAVGSSGGSSHVPYDSSWPSVKSMKTRMEHPCDGRRNYFRRGVPRKENLEYDNGSMEKTRNRPPLGKPFLAWPDHAFEEKKAAAAQALYERHLKRKGLAALQWAVQLRNIQAGIAQRSHALATMAASFRRWQDAAAKEHQAGTSRRGRGQRSPPERESIEQHPFLSQLSPEHRDEAARYSRAEGSLWMQLRHVPETDDLCRKAKALRDVRRLAAAFRLWRLQKDRLEKEEAQVREAQTFLEKKRLAEAFQAWRSRFGESQGARLFSAKIQRGMMGRCDGPPFFVSSTPRCFEAWKGFARREALSHQGLELLRLRSLRLCFRQWSRMVEAKEKSRGALLELLALKQRRSYARFTFAPGSYIVQPCLATTRWSQRKGGDTLDSLLHALALQAAFQTWRTRQQEAQLATLFGRDVERRHLRGCWELWRWKALSVNAVGLDSEDRPLTSPDLSELSLSSGFHSGGVAALPSLGKGSSRESSSRASFSSWAAMEDSGLFHDNSPSLEDIINAALECRATSTLRENRFQTLRFHNPGGEGKANLANLRQTRCGDNATEVNSRDPSANLPWAEPLPGPQDQKRVLAKYFGLWSASAHQNQEASQQWRQLLTRPFDCDSAPLRAQAWFERTQRRRLLSSCFGKWKAVSQRAGERRREAEIQSEVKRRSLRRWRKAARGYRALRLSSVNQAGNYWTRAAALRQCRRQRSSLIGPQKFTKLFPTWPCRQRWSREEDVDPNSCSSFRFWLVTYRGQSRVRRVQEDTDLMGQRNKIPRESIAGEKQRLGKYWRVWRHSVFLRQWRAAKDSRRMASAWTLWKEACKTNLLVHTLAHQRLAEWSWTTWRRRCLQSWVAERFLDTDNRHLLRKAFGWWRQLADASRHQANVHH
ncbi:uncharacterized protein C1orf167 homolog isoform X3 [Anolis carolinensis]|uniref:uncharacterized protein C1orf167 homolog isoform X3 n=1 Tax=Anolis carolinensis TaxID=28377 RepID=UPI002F2B7821